MTLINAGVPEIDFRFNYPDNLRIVPHDEQRKCQILSV